MKINSALIRNLDILGMKKREECSLQQPNRLEQHVNRYLLVDDWCLGSNRYLLVDDWCLGSKGEKSRKLVSEVGWALYWLDRSPQSHPPTGHRFLVAFGKNSVKTGLFGIWQPKASSVSSYIVRKGLLLFLKLEEMVLIIFFLFCCAVYYGFSKRLNNAALLFAVQRN